MHSAVKTLERQDVQSAGKLRYYQSNAFPAANIVRHSEFLRTGKISRPWLPHNKRYLTAQDVAEQTGRKLVKAGEMTYRRINSFHPTIQFPKLIFYRILDEIPHLGYCHITTATTSIKEKGPVHWSFYIANFSSEISTTYPFFEHIGREYSRMYFAVAVEKAQGDTLRIDRSFRKDGILFRTNDPRDAMKNVLMLGAPNDAIRALINRRQP